MASLTRLTSSLIARSPMALVQSAATARRAVPRAFSTSSSIMAASSASTTTAAAAPSAGSHHLVFEDDRQIGDYPHVEPISAQLKNPYLYEDQQERRNLDDPLHENDEYYSVWVVDEKPDVDKFTALRHLLTMFAVLAGVYGLAALYNSPARNPTVPRDLPFHQHDGTPKSWAKETTE